LLGNEKLLNKTFFLFSAALAEYSFWPNIRPIIFGQILGRKRFQSITTEQLVPMLAKQVARVISQVTD
jgi:hypothetical protein